MIQLLTFLLLLFPQLLRCDSWQSENAAGFSATVTFPNDVIIPENATIELVLTYPSDYHTSIEELKKSLLDVPSVEAPPFQLLSSGAIKENISENLIREKNLFVVAPQLEGTFSFTFRKITFYPNDESKAKQEYLISDIFTWSFRLPKNADIIPKSMPLMQITPNIPLEITQQNRRDYIDNYDLQILEAKRNEETFARKAFPRIEAVLIFLVIIFLIASKYTPKTHKPELTQEEKEKLSRSKALQRLQTLEQEHSPEKFYVELTSAVRTFLEENYKLHASTQTTEEFLHETANNAQLSENIRETLSQFLIHADQVKFALHTPTDEEKQDSLHSATRIIKENVVSSQ